MQTKKTSSEDFTTIIRIDPAGRIVGKMLPRSTFGPDVIPTIGYGETGSPRLWATANRVGLYAPRIGRWIEFDSANAKLIGNADVNPPMALDGKKAAMVDLTMTKTDSRVYAFFRYQNDDPSHVSGIYELDRSAKRWALFRSRRPSDEFGGLFGADGDELILRAGTKTFGWINLETLGRSK